MLSFFYGSGNTVNDAAKVDFLRKLAVALGNWIGNEEQKTKEVLASAINEALVVYKTNRDGVVNGVRGSQEPIDVDPESGVMTRVFSGAQTIFQMARSGLADYVVEPGLSNSAEKLALLRKAEKATPDNACEILMYFRNDLESGWAGERTLGRISLNTLVVHHVLRAYLKTNEGLAINFLALFGKEDFLLQNPSDAYKLYLMTLSRLQEKDQSARFPATSPSTV